MSIADLIPDPKGRPSPFVDSDTATYEGVIVSNPSTTAEGVLVKVAEFGEQYRFGPAPWAARFVDGDTYAIPSEGDRCLLAVTSTYEAWVIEWWPYES